MNYASLRKKISEKSALVCVVGQGYVGIHLSVAFARAGFRTTGFDISEKRIAELSRCYDSAGEVGEDTLRELQASGKLAFTTNPASISEADFILLALPSLLTKKKEPDLSAIRAASETVGKHMKRGAVVVLESSVYPGVTEEEVLPRLEELSGMRAGIDFSVGYSPERVNPGDPEHSLEKIVKVVAGLDDETTDLLAFLYGHITKAGTFKAKNIKTAEAAKIIENIQRDLNIALMNEFAIIFERMGLSIWDVLEVAKTKWNFIPFKPGLVGGYCVPVNPYYLVYKARRLGYRPRVMLAGRSTNDSMPKHIVSLTEKALARVGKKTKGSRVLVLGLSFKENVRDPRFSPVKEVIKGLKRKGCAVLAHDPLLFKFDVEKEFGVKNLDNFGMASGVDAIILATGHNEFRKIPLSELRRICNEKPVLVDTRNFFSEKEGESAGFIVVRL
ncbi:MAG: nucleotide sugar dehydrogenase [Candidatus Micrarchaeia archaeon]